MASLQGEAVFHERPDHSQSICWLHRQPEIQICLVHFLERAGHSAIPGGEAMATALFGRGHN